MTTNTTSTITREEFDLFLARLDGDRMRAGMQYESMRSAAVRYFARNGHADAQEWADETMDRLVRKNFEQQIDNLNAYMYAVARWVRVENRRKLRREVPLCDSSKYLTTAGDPHAAIEQAEQREILVRSTRQLSATDAALLTAYFPSGGDARGCRRALAQTLGISAAALRLRLCRARRRLTRVACQTVPEAAPRVAAMAA
jgi:DNA-directed RNA polymerase specialized sigma24 family protein